MSWGRGAAHASVHSVVGELVGFLVAAAQGVDDFEALELVGEAVGFNPEGAQVRAVDFVLALHLLDHELGVGDDAECGVPVFDRPGKSGDEA